MHPPFKISGSAPELSMHPAKIRVFAVRMKEALGPKLPIDHTAMTVTRLGGFYYAKIFFLLFLWAPE